MSTTTPIAGIPCYVQDLIPLIQQRLMTVLGFPVERVKIWRRRPSITEEELHVQAPQCVMIRMAGQTPERASFDGAGREDYKVSRRLIVVCWSRDSLDEVTDDVTRLTDPADGHYILELGVQNALIGFTPQDADGNTYTSSPMTSSSVTEAVPGSKDADWTRSEVLFDVPFCVSIDPEYPGEYA